MYLKTRKNITGFVSPVLAEEYLILPILRPVANCVMWEISYSSYRFHTRWVSADQNKLLTLEANLQPTKLNLYTVFSVSFSLTLTPAAYQAVVQEIAGGSSNKKADLWLYIYLSTRNICSLVYINNKKQDTVQ
jgi:hypothetical protein